jgi:hypothetical protein
MQAIMPATLVKPAPHEQRAQLANGYMNRCFCLSIHLVSATCNPKLQPNCHQAGAKFGYSSGSRLAVRSTAGCWQLVLLALRRLNVAPRHDDDAIIRIDAFGDWAVSSSFLSRMRQWHVKITAGRPRHSHSRRDHKSANREWSASRCQDHGTQGSFGGRANIAGGRRASEDSRATRARYRRLSSRNG